MINRDMNTEEKIEPIKTDEALELVKAELVRTLSKAPLIIREYTRHLAASFGKLIRASSVLTCAEDKDGLVSADAIKIAAAIEILHLATLVHDDIIDNAGLRRGDVTLQKKYGKRTAVICGDYLLSVALRMAAGVKNRKDYIDLELPDYVGRICLGELNQHINNNNLNLTVYQYLKIISGKTAALFEASFYAGALFSKSPDSEMNKYRQLGFYIGMIFQLTDDCIDFENTVETANKPVQSDYEQGVITLPLIHAFANIEELKEKAAKSTLEREEINEAVRKTDGIGFTKMVVRKYYNKSLKLIEKLDASQTKKDKLIYILNKASRLA
ncbi:MAG: polyprenyl synthetase family protein [Clostridiales bacterium]|nr:polyprenyl synthetase family protein [Clostridiales bacterium]